MKKLLFIFGFVVFGFFVVSAVHVSNVQASYIRANDPYSPFPYRDAYRVDISVTLKDSVTNNKISGTVHLWSTYPAYSCSNSVQSTIDVRNFANPNTDAAVSCAHGIWVEAYGSSNHYDFAAYCLQCNGSDCNILGHNGQTIFYTIYMDPLPPSNPAPPIPSATGVDGVPTGCLSSGSRYGGGLNLRWNGTPDTSSYTVHFTKDVRTGGDFAIKSGIGGSSTSGSGGWNNGANPNVVWLSGGNLSLSPGQTYFFAVSAQGPGGDSGFDLNGSSFQVGPVPICTGSTPTPAPTSSPTGSPPGRPGGFNIQGLPACKNTPYGSTPYGNPVNLTWSPTANTDHYAVRFTANARTNGDFGNKTVFTNSASGDGGWSQGNNAAVTWIDAPNNGNLKLQPGVTYFFIVEAFNSNGGSGIDLNSSFQVGPVNTCTAVNNPPTNGTLTAAPACVDYGTKYRFTATYNDSDGANTILYAYILINSTPDGVAATPPTGAFKAYLNNQTNEVGVRNAADTLPWDMTGSTNGFATLDRTTSSKSISGNTLTVNWDITFANTWAAENAKIYLKTTDVGGLATGYEDKGDLTVPCTPSDPDLLAAAPSCTLTSGKPELGFTFRDTSNNEDVFYLDVNSTPWTAPSFTKTLTRTPSQKTGTGLVHYAWSPDTNTFASPMDGGQVPAANTKYYFRVRAHRNNAGDSNFIYTTNAISGLPVTTSPPGVQVKTESSCAQPNFDLAIGTVNPWPPKLKWDINETATFSVVVQNKSTSDGASPPTKLYVFPNGGEPDCTSSRPVLIPPKDSANIDQSYDVPIIPQGGSVTIPVSFKVSSTPQSSQTLYMYVVPSCNFAPNPGQDPDFSNNKTPGQSYAVVVEGFFQSLGGDVGVGVGSKISNSFEANSVPAYQSDYMMVGDSFFQSHSAKPWELKGYGQNQGPVGALTDYLSKKFLKDADMHKDCNFTSGFHHCMGGDLIFDTSNTAPSGSSVFFVDHDLRIKKNLNLAPADTAVFIVSGNIIVDKSVTQASGVFITHGDFSDTDQNADPDNGLDPGANPASKLLNVRGALYLDNGGGRIRFNRFFKLPVNNSLPSVKFVYDPKYLVKMIDLIGVKSISWKEVAP